MFVWLIATVLLLPKRSVVLLVSPALALLLLMPRQRNLILAIFALAAYFKIAGDHGLTGTIPLAIGFVAVLSLSFCYFLLAARYQDLPEIVKRFPVAIAQLPTLSFIAFLWWGRIDGEVLEMSPQLVAMVSLMPFLMWRWGYLLISGRRGHVMSTGFRDHIFYLLPPFGGTNVPYGKGYDYLSSRNAETQIDAARSQLAGIKLLVLVILWQAAARVMEVIVHGAPSSKLSHLFGGWNVGLVPLASQLASDSPGDVSILTGLAMVLASLIHTVLSLAAIGHLIIGCLRLFGFNVYRNTYKPLLADSIVEFWNRFYYYFKELLVEFFFYPTFLAAGALPAKMRIFLSIMAAAFLGNFYYHFVRDTSLYLQSPIEDIISMLLPWLLYAFILALGIFVSMLRQQVRRRRKRTYTTFGIKLLVCCRRILGVWIFYSFLLILIAGPPSITLGPRLEFFLALFAIS
jgi:hypothetical protein